MAEDRGPSYYDVEVAVEYLRDRYGVGVDFLVVPPLYLASTGRKQSWQVVARCWRLSDSRETGQGARQGFGRGGSWGTCPAAMHSALLELQAKLESAELKRSKQAAF